MSRRNPPAKWVLPQVINPADSICYQVPVPDDIFHRAAFWGAMLSLASAYKWQDDALHRAKQTAIVWRDIIDNMKPGCDDCPDNPGEFDGEELMSSLCESLRWHNGVLQAFCCGEWVDIPGGGPANNIQPTGGGTLEPGEERCVKATLQANGQWLLPFPVSSGDLITVDQTNGAWSDGTLNWYCPNGGFYTLGACGTGSAPSGSDPLPTVSHMQLIALIAGVYYKVIDNVLPVPSGLTDEQVIFLANDSTASDNTGSVDFNVCVKAAPPANANINITYNLGTGPATVQDGDTLVLNAACCGGGGASDWGVNLLFDHPVLVHVVGTSGFTVTGGGGIDWAYGQNPPGTVVQTLNTSTTRDPLDWDDTIPVEIFDMECGGCGVGWSITIVVANP